MTMMVVVSGVHEDMCFSSSWGVHDFSQVVFSRMLSTGDAACCSAFDIHIRLPPISYTVIMLIYATCRTMWICMRMPCKVTPLHLQKFTLIACFFHLLITGTMNTPCNTAKDVAMMNTLPKFNSSPLKSYRNPIGKDRLPTSNHLFSGANC